jgi:hypothetical protein
MITGAPAYRSQLGIWRAVTDWGARGMEIDIPFGVPPRPLAGQGDAVHVRHLVDSPA